MKIIIDNSDESSYGPDAMANSVCICDCILKDAKDGDNVKSQIEGVLVDHGDGKRYIAIHTVDGEPVEEMDSEDYGNNSNKENPMDMNAEDALSHFMQQQGK